MHCRIFSAAALAALFACPLLVSAQDVRYYQDPNTGHTYRQTTTTIQRQMPVTQYQASTRSVLRGQWRTDTQDVVRTYSVPVTEYRTESYWQGRYNPFVQPTLATRTVPTTRWETRTEIVKVPVTRYETVPTTETVHVPVTTYQTVQDQVVHHQVVAPGTANSAVVATSNGSSIGGVAQLDPRPTMSGSSSSSDSSLTAGGSKTQLSR
ncbi:MAG TPA: hypothetical protein VHD36_01330 [Pirellulales bacterium]|nr:hypothetical protein [Pirellulales bacterium]